MTTLQLAVLALIAVLGHLMALFWWAADRRGAALCGRRIYELPPAEGQLKRELFNSVHTPTHAALLAVALWLGAFRASSSASLAWTLLLTVVWAEIWHYVSHRAMHLKRLHWIHREHHKSRVNTPLTAISFSFTEKLIFSAGIIGALALIDLAVPLNFYGVAAWYVVYLTINSFSHANFEIKSDGYLAVAGKVLTSTTYHSLHHSRYINNYGLGTRFLDRFLGTEWEDYEDVYQRVTGERRPLTSLKEKVGSPMS